MKEFKPEAGRIYESVPNTLYHADKTAVSSTWVKTYQQTPFHLKQKLDAPPEPEPSLALVKGQAIDSMVFDGMQEAKESFIILPEDLNLRTKAGREYKAEAVKQAAEDNLYVIKHADWQECALIAASVLENPMAAELLSDGKSQETFVWRDPDTNMLCKCKTDFYNPKHRAAIDLKSAENGSPSGFSRAVANFGYHIQDAFYTDGIRRCGRDVHEFIFIVVEKPLKDMKPDPRLVSFYRLNPVDVEEGRRSYKAALAGISMCQLTDDWPGYTEDVIEIMRPGWARQADVEEQL